MAGEPDQTEIKSLSLKQGFKPAMRLLTGAFLGADLRAERSELNGSPVMKAALEEGKRFDAFVGQSLVFGVEVMDKLRILTGNSSAVAGGIADEAEKKQKQRDEDAHFQRILELIREGQVNHYIAGEIFGSKTDSEILGIVADIEAATGDSFENYARRILGEDGVPERLDDESEADYQRRVLTAIAAETLDPHTGRIKPQYADDPVAKIVAREEIYKRTTAFTHEVAAEFERGEISLPQLMSRVEDQLHNAAEAHQAARKTDNKTVKGAARHLQDGLSDGEADSRTAENESASFFGQFSSRKSAVDVAAEKGKQAFNSNAPDADPFPETGGAPNQNLDVKPS